MKINQKSKFIVKFLVVMILTVICSSIILVSAKENSADIENGIYTIQSALSERKVIDISNASVDEGVNVHLWSKNGSAAQKFHIMKSGDCYVIKAVCSGKVLDVADGESYNGNNVHQWSSNGTNAQRWQFIDAGDGYYYIKSMLGRYLDVSGGNTNDGANVQIYEGNGTNAQKWKLINVAENVPTGVYTIETALNSNKVLDVSNASKNEGANIQLWSKNGSDAQKFNISMYGYCGIITGVCSGKVLDIADGRNYNGNNVRQWTPNGTNAQKWFFVDAGNGYFYIISPLGRYLDVSGGYTADGTNIQIYEGNGTNAQKWKLLKETSGTNSSVLQFPLKGAIKRTSTSSKTNKIYCDYTAGMNTPIYAPADGKVTYKQTYAKVNGKGEYKLVSYGNQIEFTSGSYRVLMGHLNSFNGVNLIIPSNKTAKVSVSRNSNWYNAGAARTAQTIPLVSGKDVKQGELIGYSGETGNAHGPHLHLEVYKNGQAVNPTSVFKEW